MTIEIPTWVLWALAGGALSVVLFFACVGAAFWKAFDI